MSSQRNTKQINGFTGRHMLLCMLGFFGMIVTVNITMATFASNSWTGLVVRNSYVASQQYNDTLARAKAQRNAGMRSKLAYEKGTLLFSLENHNGVSLSVSEMKLKIGRPAFEQADSEHKFMPRMQASYQLPLDLQPGIWLVVIEGETNHGAYRRDTRLLVDAKGNGRFE